MKGLKLIQFIFIFFGMMSVQVQSQNTWKYKRPAISESSDIFETYTGAVTLDNGNTIATGFRSYKWLNPGLSSTSKIMTSFNTNGIIVKDTLITINENEGIFFSSPIKGTNRFFTLSISQIDQYIKSTVWSEKFERISDTQIYFNQSDIFRPFFRHSVLQNGNFLFFTYDSDLIFEVDQNGKFVSQHMLHDISCYYLLQKTDGSGFYCFGHENVLLKNDFSVDLTYGQTPFIYADNSLEAQFSGDYIYIGTVDFEDSTAFLPTIFKLDKNLNILKKINVSKFSNSEFFLMNGLKILENGDILFPFKSINSTGDCNTSIGITDTTLNTIRNVKVDVFPHFIINMAMSVCEPDYFYITGYYSFPVAFQPYSSAFVLKNKLSIFSAVQNVSTKNTLSVFPNPAFDKLFISDMTSAIQTELWNTSGVRLKKTMLQKDETLDISDLIPGIYLLHVISREGNTQSARFVKF
jgi:hypothetical protein